MVKIISTFPSTPVGHLTNVFLGIERTEDALASWLQTHGPNILPDSVFITASVLFGLVDSHDLMSLLEMILGEVVKQMQLQQEDSCIQFLKQGGRCFMEEMMYRAQMEVSLYSKAIANLCEELDARNQPASGRLHPNLVLASVNTIGSTEASSRTLNFCPFQPLNDIQDKSYKKCQAWLLKSNIQDTAEVGFDVSQMPLTLLHDDNSSPLPRLMKAWVDNVIYRSYMSASLAESNEPLPTMKGNRFTRKETKAPAALMSVFHILDLKKQRAQIEVDMLYDAIVRIAELDATDDDAFLLPFQSRWRSSVICCIGASHELVDARSFALQRFILKMFDKRYLDIMEKPFSTSPVLVFMSWPQKVGPKVLAIDLDMSAIIAKKLIPDTIWSAVAIMDIGQFKAKVSRVPWFTLFLRFLIQEHIYWRGTILLKPIGHDPPLPIYEAHFTISSKPPEPSSPTGEHTSAPRSFCGPIRFTDLMTSPRVEPTEVKKSVFESIPLNQIAGLVDRLLSVGALHPAIAILTRLPLPESALYYEARLTAVINQNHQANPTRIIPFDSFSPATSAPSEISEDRALDVIALAEHYSSEVLASATIEHCIQSRCLLSPTGMDSDFCAQLIEVMHTQGTPGFPTLVVYDKACPFRSVIYRIVTWGLCEGGCLFPQRIRKNYGCTQTPAAITVEFYPRCIGTPTMLTTPYNYQYWTVFWHIQAGRGRDKSHRITQERVRPQYFGNIT
ncbi:hypothetical protein C8R48DRAFT_798753 [Suillus tomentosus]|nr:hypothetical protein C8R48DRAFT_798753 [Suillus tomentosus]